MKKRKIVILVTMLFTFGAGFTIHPYADETVPYPEGYRKWVHIKTGLIGPTSPSFQTTGGFHHIYANDKAMAGYTLGNFPEGSIIVFDVLEAIEKNGNTTEGKRRHVDVMIKDSIKYRSTGGWGYEEFKGNSKTERVLTETVRTQCFNCHTSEKDHVFSNLRE
jgi:hypothetical protein